MPAAPRPENEYARLLDLARYDILDSAPEETFDRLTRLVARTLRAPAAIINFVDQYRQWGKSCFGTGDSTGPREHSFCAWTILSDDVMVVEDATQDARFADNPQVTGAPHIHLYAGAPLITPSGHRLGSICVIDSQPRTLDDDDRRALQDFAALIMDELEFRVRNKELQQEVGAQAQVMRELRRTATHAHTLEAVNALLDAPLTPEDATLAAARAIGEAIHADWTGLVTAVNGAPTVQTAHHLPDTPPALLDFAAHLQEYQGVTSTLLDTTTPTYIEEYALHPNAIGIAVEAGLSAAAWLPLGRYDDTVFLLVAVRADRGRRHAWRASDRALLDAAGRSVRSALDRRTVQAAAERAARLDTLTGAGNRLSFEEDLNARIHSGAPFTLAAIDLDGFKSVNDTEGHAQGDKLLRVFTATLQSEISDAGRVYRPGGDEFALLSPLSAEEIEEIVDVAVVAARGVTTARVGASVGVTAFPDDGTTPDTLLRTADDRMYAVKRRRQALRDDTPGT
ncbi:sensor domain-containing diguanylate cyclase [Deinococcus maricopensis]|uniref:Diguanylate cyclase with GAF sensor n=1 Tax=Deinococcus maricopensis (strain DSM 21211 / LMG 22137 / NRRL B-23946 / LB-34) TaxID=709986 RepID=E8U3U9_DEIML|nr:sensor domain-containing diguanylate cyclase [Deinococcus maricopensis]ADV68792.1 diguanylate cyclase with GAF sensor [Deinococcus maricopensis DSM 21211]